ncbi:DUF1707 SHOCT-like domain-containing protein [Acidipropionibacterium virtanenii]|uniref:Uncharacterized protein n=1 Tax=Acidipropionibacterium virtanenii TaxID=2057246 RepID=A0A344UWY9_9ACTN|nr:DUF1707 domain-containing protein [Acidipropionibacterium virtanenii]AXE39787.1 hypothetical protein JS278_02650 [Acidipropionibacterium virtanenii]
MIEPSPEDRHLDMRVGDMDRTRVAELLDEAYADGRLDREEHDERAASAITARTFGDLAVLTRDLDPAAVSPRASASSAMVPATSRVPVVAGPPDDRIVTIMGDVTRGAGHTLAARTEIVSGLGDVKLDLTSMSLAAHDVVIEIRSVMGDIKIMVPEGMRVIDQTGRFLGDSKFDGLVPSGPDDPTVTLTGFLALGDVKVYGPEHVSFAKKLRKWFG